MEAVISQAALTGAPDFESLLAEYQSMVFSIALNFLRDRGVAEELSQDVFLTLHRHLGSIESNDHARHWLRRVTTQRCIDRTRRVKVRGETALESAGQLAVSGTAPDVLAESRLRRLVASLPEQLRAVVILRYQEDLDVPEIAATLGIPVRTARAHLDKALALLREKEQRWNRS